MIRNFLSCRSIICVVYICLATKKFNWMYESRSTLIKNLWLMPDVAQPVVWLRSAEERELNFLGSDQSPTEPNSERPKIKRHKNLIGFWYFHASLVINILYDWDTQAFILRKQFNFSCSISGQAVFLIYN